MILRKKGPTLLWLLILQLVAIVNTQNARSYDTSDWIPISQPCSDCKSNEHVIEKKATGRVLNLPERSRKTPFRSDEYRNVRQANNYQQQYLPESGRPTKQKQRPINKEYAQQNVQFEIPQNHQLSPAQLQQAYTSQHLLPNIDLITRQVLQQSQKIAQQVQPLQGVSQNPNPNQYQIVPQQIYNQGLIPQNVLKQNYPTLPHQFLLPQQLQQQQAQLYQQQFIQQPQLQTYQLAQPQKQQLNQGQNANQTAELYDSAGIQNFNQELLNADDQSYRTVDITSTTPKTEKENVQLLYVPLEHLQQKQQQNRPDPKPTLQSQKRHRHKQVTQPLKKEHLLESIEQDFIQQALQAHRLQQELDQPRYYTPSFITTPPSTTTLKSVSRKRKPHQPPLAVYMNGSGSPKVTDVLNALKDAKTIDVQDTIGTGSPHVFVGPANLDPPEGFTKFELPYLSNIESNRIERKVDQLPFFVAPLNYKAPTGYSKIPFPSPHVGSVVINNNELERSRLLEAVPSVEDFLNPYQLTQPAPVADVKPTIESASIKPVTQEEEPRYHVRKPSRTRGRQQNRGRTHSSIVAEQTVQAGPSVNYVNGYESGNKQNVNLYHTNPFPTVSSTISPDIQNGGNLPNVEINNPSLNLSNQHRKQIPGNQYLTFTNEGPSQGNFQLTRQKVNGNFAKSTPATASRPKQRPTLSGNFDYYEISNLPSSPSVQAGNKQETSTLKEASDFDIVPSVSTTISPFNGKESVQDFYREFGNFQADSVAPTVNYYDDQSNRNVGDVFSIIPTVSSKQDGVNNDRRYLPLDSQAHVPPRQIDYEDIFQLPLGANQLAEQKPVNAGNEAPLRTKSQGSITEENYKILEEYTISSSSPALKEENVNSHVPRTHSGRQPSAKISYEENPVKQPIRQRTRGRIPQQVESQKEYIPTQHTRSQSASQENYESVPIPDQEVIAEKTVNVNNYANNFQVSSSPITNPVLPGLINDLEDSSIRQLLTPILLAPPEKIKSEVSVIPQPTQPPIAYDHFSETTPEVANYRYKEISIPTTQAPSPPQSIQVETTTQRRTKNRGRGNSRYNDRTTTSSPRRNPNRIRTQHPSRNRFRQTITTTTTTTEAYVPVKQHVYTTTTETPRKFTTRQRFKTKGRPLQTEYHSTTPKISRIPETTTPQIVIPKQEPEPKIEIQHTFYEEQPPVRKPQLITRSKILTPEEEYLVNKYNLQVTTIEDPVTDNVNVQILSQNVQDEPPEQRLDSSKSVEIHQSYRTTSITPTVTEVEVTTKQVVPKKQTYPANHNIIRNPPRTEHPPVKIRTRIRTRKTTPKPTTTTTTVRNMLSSASSIEEQGDDFYGFLRQPEFSRPPVKTTVKTPYRENSLYHPIVIGGLSNADLYEDEDVETNGDGIQIFTNNQHSSSTPIHFIGELLPRQVTTEKYYEATYEPLPPPDRYISISTSTTTQEPKRKGRLSLRKAQDSRQVNQIETAETTTRRAPLRTRTRGRSHYKSPIAKEQSDGNDNYPELYLRAKNDNQQYTPQTANIENSQSPTKSVNSQTEKPSFQITIDPGEEGDENEDQEPYSSVLRPKVVPPTANHWSNNEKPIKKHVGDQTTEVHTIQPYDTTTITRQDVESTTPTSNEFTTITQKPKKRGYWKLVKLRKITEDDFDVAESQNVPAVSLNMLEDEVKKKDRKKIANPVINSDYFDDDSRSKETTDTSTGKTFENEDDFVNSLYTIFRLTTVKPESVTTDDFPETTLVPTTDSATTTTSTKSSSEIQTTVTPLMPEELETTTTDAKDASQTSRSNDISDLDDVTINEDDHDWSLGYVETSTSTSTEISHETEICFKGICVKSNEMN